MSETWRPVPGFEGLYEVSDAGRVRSLDRVVVAYDGHLQPYRGVVLTPKVLRRDGRLSVNLHREGRRATVGLHRVVLEAFVGPCPAGLEGCHNNGDPADNRVTNLRWDTPSSNARDRVAHGRDNHRRRTRCPRGHWLRAPNLSVAHLRRGQRNCLACNRAAADVCKAKKRGAVLDYSATAARHYARIMGAAA